MSNLSRRIRTVEPIKARPAEHTERKPQKTKAMVEPAADLAKRGRGRPSSGKERVTIRLDADVLASYRSLGPGWQGVLNSDLRKIRRL